MSPFIFPVVFIVWIGLNLWLNRRAQRLPKSHTMKRPIDDRIPFVSVFALPYFSAYILGIMGYVLMIGHPDLGRVYQGYLILVALGFLAYWFYPCRVERRENLTVDGLSTFVLNRFQRLSGPYNSFPSMHVAHCLYSALIGLRYHEAYGIWLIAWAALVAVSTLLTKQHHVLDVAAGVLLAIAVFKGVF